MVEEVPITGLKGKPVAWLCTSQTRLDRLIDGSRRLSNGNDFVLLLRDNERLLKRVIPAYINAMIRHHEGTKRAKSVQMEMLLFISGTMNIGNAIKDAGARTASRFIAVSNSSKLLAGFAKAYGVKKLKVFGLRFDPDTAGEVSITELKSAS